jgi:hypothetical protein
MSRVLHLSLFVIATLALSIKQVDLLGWDDADYIRMVSCLNHAILNSSGTEFLTCEKGIYKAPIFVNIFVLLFPLIFIFNVTQNLTPEFQVNVYIFFLTFITVALFVLMYQAIKSPKMKLLFILGSITLFRNYQYLFMTDVLSAILCGITFVYYLNIRNKNLDSNKPIDPQEFWKISILVVICLGIRTTTAPLILVLFSLFYMETRKKSKNQRVMTTFVALFAPIILFGFLALFVWKPLFPSALDMFLGNQSKYFAEWNSNSLLQTLREAYSIYWAAAMIIIVMMVRLSRSGMNFREVISATWIPSSFIIFFGVSGTKDPRFLIWPFFVLMAGLAFVEKHEMGFTKMIFPSRKYSAYVLFAYVLILSFLTTPWKSTLGLDKAIVVYSQIGNNDSKLCPLTDSPDLNISKVLLIDELQGGKKRLNTRIVNIPDQKMQGSTRLETLELLRQCNLWYSEDGIESGTQKNEWLNDFKLFLESKYFKKDEGLTFYK